MILLQTNLNPLFIIAAMDPNFFIMPTSPRIKISPPDDTNDLSANPLGKKSQQLLVSLLLATTLSNARNFTASDDQGNLSSNPYGTEPQFPPLEGIVTQEFHSGHKGIDTAVPIGTRVKATMNGNVIHAGWNIDGYGNLVIIQNGEFKTYYAHLSKIPVNIGDYVRSGMTIGFSGSTGNSTGPHLHYEVRINDVPVDPGKFNGKANPYKAN